MGGVYVSKEESHVTEERCLGGGGGVLKRGGGTWSVEGQKKRKNKKWGGRKWGENTVWRAPEWKRVDSCRATKKKLTETRA